MRYFVKIEKYILLKVITGSCLSLRCLIFKVLAVAPELSLSRGDLFILSHFQAFVKRFLKLFWKVFFGCLCRRSQNALFCFQPISELLFRKQVFSQVLFFRNPLFMQVFSFFLLSRATALLSYHLFLLLSTLFSDFFPFITNCIIYFIFSSFFPFFTLQFVDFVTKSTILTKISFSIAIIW